MIQFALIVVMYFSFSWGLPWHLIPSSISFSYLFDLLFAVGVSFIFRLPWVFKWHAYKNAWKLFVEAILFAWVCVLAIWYFDIPAPFRVVNNLEWHLLFLAPILEELVFRQTFQRVLIHRVGGKGYTSLLSAAIFAASHFVALKVLPDEFIPFIGFQFFYTFVLGLICGQAMLRFHSIVAPILIHFLFNLSFYLGLQLELF